MVQTHSGKKIAYGLLLAIAVVATWLTFLAHGEALVALVAGVASGIAAALVFEISRDVVSWFFRRRATKFFGPALTNGTLRVAVARGGIANSSLGQLWIDGHDGEGAIRLLFRLSLLSERTLETMFTDESPARIGDSVISVGLGSNAHTTATINACGNAVTWDHSVSSDWMEIGGKRVTRTFVGRPVQDNDQDVACVVRLAPAGHGGTVRFVCGGLSHHGSRSACMFLAERWRELDKELRHRQKDYQDKPGVGAVLLRTSIHPPDNIVVEAITWKAL